MILFGITPGSFGQLGIFEKQIKQCSENIATIKVKFLRPYCIAYLHQILINELFENPEKRLHSTYPIANQYLKQCGFDFLPENVICENNFPQEHIIKLYLLNAGSINEDEKITNWIELNILRFLPKLNPALKKKIVKNLWEIISNSLLHSESKSGVSICGQFYPQKGYFELAFCDNGLGIANVVKSHDYIKKSDEDYKCIIWATQEGTSTKPQNISGGLGLYILKEFIKLNKGALQIISGNGYFGNTEGINPVPNRLKNYISGTIVNLRIIFDQNLYSI